MTLHPKKPWWKFWPVICWKHWMIVRRDDICHGCFRETKRRWVFGQPLYLAPGRKCKNCGRDLRGLRNAPEIPIHMDTESRFCDVGYYATIPPIKVGMTTRYAEWSESDV
jgi:hypothetical protein